MSTLLLLAALPALHTLLAFHLELGTAWSYPGGKLLLALLPLVYFLRQGAGHSPAGVRGSAPDSTPGIPLAVLREHMGLARAGVLPGLLWGLVLAAGIAALTWIVLPYVESGPFLAKMQSLGLSGLFIPAALVISCINAGYEEWYWRGFLVGMAKQRLSARMLPFLPLVLGVMFGLHHALALGNYAGPGLTAGLTGVTMLAGALWTHLRLRGVGLAGLYISHVLADMAIAITFALNFPEVLS